MKKIIFFVITGLIGIALFIGVIWNVGFAKIWETINYFSISKWFAVLFLNLCQLFITVYRWRLILRSQGHNISMGRLLGAKLVGFSVDYSTPSPNIGGEAIRAYVLKKETGVDFSQGLASIIIDKVLDFSYALPFLIFSIIYILIKFSISWKLIALLLVISLSFIFLLSFFYYKTLRHKQFFTTIINFLQLYRLSFISKMMDKIKNFEQIIINFFHHDKKTFYQGLALSLLGGFFAIGSLWLILVFLGLHANFIHVIIISTLTVVTFLLPIPGSFGSTETGEAIIFNTLGFTAQMGVAFSLIFRSVDLIKVAFGFLFLSQFGLKISQTILKGQGVKTENNNGQRH